MKSRGKSRKMNYFPIYLAIICYLLVPSHALLPYLTALDQESMKNVFLKAASSGAKSPAENLLSAVSYGVSGLKALKVALPEPQKLCAYANSKVDQSDVESVYEASALAANLGNCKLVAPKAQETLENGISAEKSCREIYYAAHGLANLKLKLDSAKLDAALSGAIKNDDSAANLGYAFHTALLLTGNLKSYVDRIEDTVAQADELDSKYLQFEGGLTVTGIVISGIYALAEKANQTPSIKADEAVKFGNYLLSRRGVQLPRPAFHLFTALQTLTSNKYHIPVSFSLASSVAVTKADPALIVKICDVLGRSVGPLSVTIDSAIHAPTSGVVISRQPLSAVPGDNTNTLYQFNFLEAKRDKGFYKLTVSAGSQKDKRLVGTQAAEINLKVMAEMEVSGVELSLVDREQMATANVLKPSPPAKLKDVLEADYHQKLMMQFTVKDKDLGKSMRIHQAFIVFVHLSSKQEIVFVAEADNKLTYKFDVDLLKSAKDFDYLSGKYSMKLILGDSVVGNPMAWDVLDANLKFPKQEKKSKGEGISWQKRPEIKHMFREPEKRPPQVVSTAFTGLVLVPVLILLILWLTIGINISNFPLSIFALGFHLGIAAIFGLYFVFWLQLNMFQTLKYLAGIGGVTFICGNRMLRGVAERRKAKSE